MLAVLLFLVCSACTTPPAGDPSAHTWHTEATSIVEERHSMGVGSSLREFILHRPLEVHSGERLPVVIVLHGNGNGARTIAGQVQSEFNVDARRFIAVFPQGHGNAWNLGVCCTPANTAYIDDFLFFDKLTAYLATRPDVAGDQISIAGGSLGGITAYQYACIRADRLAGLVSASGTHITSCLPNAPVPTMQIHSLTDNSIAYDGGFTSTELLLGLDFPAVVPTVETWAAANGHCPDGPTQTEHVVNDLATATVWDCGGTTTWLETLDHGEHAMPIIGDYVVADAVFDFLLGPLGSGTLSDDHA